MRDYFNAKLQAMDIAKGRIRERETFRSRVLHDAETQTHTIGFRRVLELNPLDGDELQELLSYGIAYPLTGDICVSFGEYLLNRDIERAHNNIIEVFGDDLSLLTQLTQNRYIVLLEIMFYLGIKVFRRFKRFISAVKKEEWETAIYDFLSKRESLKLADRFEEYIEKFRNG